MHDQWSSTPLDPQHKRSWLSQFWYSFSRSLLAYANCSWSVGFWKIKWISHTANSAPPNSGTPEHGVMDLITLVNASLFSDCLLHAEGGFKDGIICLFYKKMLRSPEGRELSMS